MDKSKEADFEKWRQEQITGASADTGGTTWRDEIELLRVREPREVVIEGHRLTVACPKTGVWFQALPVLMDAFDEAHKIFGEDSVPIGVVMTLFYRWDLPKVILAFGQSWARVLDMFLAKEPGWCVENLTPFGMASVTSAFLGVIPAAQMKVYFAPFLKTHLAVAMQPYAMALAKAVRTDKENGQDGEVAAGSASSSPTSGDSTEASTGGDSKSASS